MNFKRFFVLMSGLMFAGSGFTQADSSIAYPELGDTVVFGYGIEDEGAEDENILVRDFVAVFETDSSWILGADTLIVGTVHIEFEIKEPAYFGDVSIEVAEMREEGPVLIRSASYSMSGITTNGWLANSTDVNIPLDGIPGKTTYLVSISTSSSGGNIFRVLTQTIMP